MEQSCPFSTNTGQKRDPFLLKDHSRDLRTKLPYGQLETPISCLRRSSKDGKGKWHLFKTIQSSSYPIRPPVLINWVQVRGMGEVSREESESCSDAGGSQGIKVSIVCVSGVDLPELLVPTTSRIPTRPHPRDESSSLRNSLEDVALRGRRCTRLSP